MWLMRLTGISSRLLFPFPVHHSRSHAHEFSLCFPFPWDSHGTHGNSRVMHTSSSYSYSVDRCLFVPLRWFWREWKVSEILSRLSGPYTFLDLQSVGQNKLFWTVGARPFIVCLLVAVGGIRCWRHPWELITAGFRRCSACNDLKLWRASLFTQQLFATG